MSDRQEIEDALNEKDARIAELQRELAVRKAAIEAQFRLMERVRELEEALQAMPCACGSWLRAGLGKCPRCTALGL